MQNCDYCQKKMLLKIMLSVLNKKPAEIAREVNVSKSLVSKYLAGESEQSCSWCDIVSSRKGIYKLEFASFVRNS